VQPEAFIVICKFDQHSTTMSREQSQQSQIEAQDQWDSSLLDGFPRMAAFIARDSDKMSTVYRRFDKLSARNLLHLQSKVAALQAEQDRLDKQSYASRNVYPDTVTAASDWEYLENAGMEGHRLAGDITSALKEYRK
jgi:hypothetical protein